MVTRVSRVLDTAEQPFGEAMDDRSRTTRQGEAKPRGAGEDEKYHFAFVMDQQVGLRTHAMNVEQAVSRDRSIRPAWVPVSYELDNGWQKRVPGIPAALRGTLMGAEEIRRGLQRAGEVQAVLWASWAAKCVPDLMARVPSFLVMDMTPVQMEGMGELYGYSRARARFLGNWKRRATERLYAQATHLFPWSNWVAASLCSDYGVPGDKVSPLSPGVDVSLYHPDPDARGQDGVVRVLFVGGDFARKGGDLLLRWARETRLRARLELHLVTRDPVPSQRRVIVHQEIKNNSPELVRLYQESDLLVLPTRADCYSLVSLEAMASGLPVVTSRLGGIPEIVAEGETGLLTWPGDYPALAAALDQLIEDPELRARMGAAARKRACAQFDARANVERILAMMKNAVRQPGCGRGARPAREGAGGA